MKIRNLMAAAALAGLCVAVAAPAFAGTFDVCATAATDAKFDSTGTFVVATAPIYLGGTIAQSSTPVDCSTITATPAGTFFVVGAFVTGLPHSGPQDAAM
ncbi:MAG: hypothetical protein ACREQC_07740, partial [Candidatus Binataceae bacterium]